MEQKHEVGDTVTFWRVYSGWWDKPILESAVFKRRPKTWVAVGTTDLAFGCRSVFSDVPGERTPADAWRAFAKERRSFALSFERDAEKASRMAEYGEQMAAEAEGR